MLLGAVISHVIPDASERPIGYGSRSLSKNEQNYSQLEKEALAIIFRIKKFHKFLYGRPFTLVTDHKPLVTILGPRAPVPTLAAAQLQRWSLLLSGYQYKVEFRLTTEHANADCLSRLPLHLCQSDDTACKAPALFNISQIGLLPIKADQVKQASSQDTVLSRVITTLWMDGHPLWIRNYGQLTTEAGCISCVELELSFLKSFAHKCWLSYMLVTQELCE